MKKLYSLILFIFIITDSIFAVEYLKTGVDGKRYYKCGKPGYTGVAKITRIRKDFYLLQGKHYSGNLKADSFQIAAQVACGEVQEKSMRYYSHW